MALPPLDELVSLVDGDDALERIVCAEELAAELVRLGDRVIGWFIEQARAEGASWSDIGAQLGITRQAAQQRLGPRLACLTLGDLVASGSLRRHTPRALAVLRGAEAHARRLRHDTVARGHVLLAIVDDGESLAVDVVRRVGTTAAKVRKAVTAAVGRGDGSPDAIPVGPAARRTFEAALVEALGLGHNYIGTEHLLLGVLHDATLADATGIDLDEARDAVRDALGELLSRAAR